MADPAPRPRTKCPGARSDMEKRAGLVRCRVHRVLGVLNRAAIMVGLEAGLSQARIARSIGRSPSVVCREIARHAGPDGVYRAEEVGKAAHAARRRPKERECWIVIRFFAAA